jgi:hypothetical protein
MRAIGRYSPRKLRRGAGGRKQQAGGVTVLPVMDVWPNGSIAFILRHG